MNIALWIAQVLLAALFLKAGATKSFKTKEDMIKAGMNLGETSMPMIRFIGYSEVLGAIGLILPVLFNILPILTAVSAFGFAVIMVLAIAHHYKFKEYKAIGFNLVILALSLFVAWGRFA
jgi:putative oxidoreductase